jgi:adenosylcobinamide kinase / adenosylcobinamide-phosphate guanylyltransferase
MNRITFVVGGARSGKSRYAEQLAKRVKSKTYIATALPFDEEMRERIRLHRDRRGEGWITVETELDLVGALEKAARPNSFVLIDCLTLWLNNLVHHRVNVDSEVDRLCDCLERRKGHVVLVANEVGMGIVPGNPLARQFRDEAGRLNQRIAEIADDVVMMVAGLAMFLKTARRSAGGSRRARSSHARKA